MIFRRSKSGRVHVYRGPDPATVNQAPASSRQAAVRTVYAQALAEWQLLSDDEHQAFKLAALQQGLAMTGWNLYFQQFQVNFGSLLATDDGQLLRTDVGDLLVVD